MPELPEVETVSKHLQCLVGQTIKHIAIHRPKLRYLIDPKQKQQLPMQIVKSIQRRGKYIIVTLSQDQLIIHLGMSGVLRIFDQAPPLQKHDHIVVSFENGQTLILNDPRRFGAWIFTSCAHDHPLIAKLGPEPLSKDFNAEYLYQICQKKRLAIKKVLMDSHVVVGIGNIYANEALFQSGIHPLSLSCNISLQHCQKLYTACVNILEQAIAKGGTTLKDFKKTDGKPGYFSQELLVYGKKDQPCPVCNTKLEDFLVSQRHSICCPNCQKRV